MPYKLTLMGLGEKKVKGLSKISQSINQSIQNNNKEKPDRHR